MSEIDKRVFGISTGVFREHHPFGFANAYAYVVGDTLELIADPMIEFPKRGSFYLPQRLGIPEEGEGGIWQVKRRSDYYEDETNEYMAASRPESAPYEIIGSSLTSDNPDAIRRQLIDGFRLPYKPMKRVLVSLADKTLIGPLELDSSVGGNVYPCFNTSFENPLSHWLDPGLLHPVECTIGGNKRTFSGSLSLPPSEAYLDCAELCISVKSVLRYYHRLAGKRRLLSRGQITDIVGMIKENDNPGHIAARFSKVEAALKQIVQTGDNLEELDEYLFSNDSVQARIEAAAQTRIEEVESRILEEKLNLNGELADLRSKKTTMLKHIKKLERQKEVISSDIEGILEEATQVFQEKLRKAKGSPEQLIGEILALKPFMSVSSTVGLRATTVTSQDEVTALEDIKEALQIVSDNLQSIGIRSTYARKLSAEILSAIFAGQMACFSGILAPLFDQAICKGLSGEKSISIPIPARSDISSEFEAEFNAATGTWEVCDNLLVVSIKGVNHSCFEIFGQKLIEKVISDTCMSANRNSLALIATLSDGPSTYPVSDTLLSIGPLFNVENLPMTSRKKLSSIRTGSLTKEAVRVFCQKAVDVGTNASLEDHLREFTTLYNSHYRTSLRILAGILRRVLAVASAKAPQEVEDQTILDSLAFGWLIPKLRQCCGEKKAIEDLKNLLGDSEDERIASEFRNSL